MVKRLWQRFCIWTARLRRWPPSHRVEIPELTVETRRAVLRSLVGNPGWHYIMAELEDRKALYEQKRIWLTSRIPTTVNAEQLTRELICTDEAVFWIGWVQDKVRRAEAMPPLQERREHAAEQSLQV